MHATNTTGDAAASTAFAAGRSRASDMQRWHAPPEHGGTVELSAAWRPAMCGTVARAGATWAPPNWPRCPDASLELAPPCVSAPPAPAPRGSHTTAKRDPAAASSPGPHGAGAQPADAPGSHSPRRHLGSTWSRATTAVCAPSSLTASRRPSGCCRVTVHARSPWPARNTASPGAAGRAEARARRATADNRATRETLNPLARNGRPRVRPNERAGRERAACSAHLPPSARGRRASWRSSSCTPCSEAR